MQHRYAIHRSCALCPCAIEAPSPHSVTAGSSSHKLIAVADDPGGGASCRSSIHTTAKTNTIVPDATRPLRVFPLMTQKRLWHF
jgi:hypothetical protein